MDRRQREQSAEALRIALGPRRIEQRGHRVDPERLHRRRPVDRSGVHQRRGDFVGNLEDGSSDDVGTVERVPFSDQLRRAPRIPNAELRQKLGELGGA
jgi:hypothetical protein